MRSRADVERVFDLWDAGWSKAEIARRSGVPTSTVSRWLAVDHERLMTNRAPSADCVHSTCGLVKNVALFCRACDAIGVEWRVSNRKTISVARRASVAKLEAIVGPKR